jgi:hypothetical protein
MIERVALVDRPRPCHQEAQQEEHAGEDRGGARQHVGLASHGEQRVVRPMPSLPPSLR